MNWTPRGKYFEEFMPGDTFCSIGRTICECDIMSFAGLTGDYNPLHTNKVYAVEVTEFKDRIAHGLLGLSIMAGMIHQLGIMEGTTIAFLESRERFVSPLYIGDTVYCVVHVLEKRLSSKPERGIVTLSVTLYNQNEATVIEQKQIVMVRTRMGSKFKL
jgi:acyl dehydratase